MITNNSNISYASDTATLNISINVDDERFDILDETMCNLFIYLTDSENNPIEGDYSYTGDVISISISVLILSIAILCRLIKIKK